MRKYSALLLATALLAGLAVAGFVVSGGDGDTTAPRPRSSSSHESPSAAPATTPTSPSADPAGATEPVADSDDPSGGARTAPARPCSPEVVLPALRRHFEPDGGPDIVGVDVRECQHGYARVHALADNSTCGQPGGSCYENEQVFLQASGDSWTVVTYGTGISCQDADITPDLALACDALGLPRTPIAAGAPSL